MEKILLARHLEDINDLKTYGRDAPIENTHDNNVRLNEISDAVYEKLQKNDKKAVIFVTSPRIRAHQTAALVAENIENRSISEINVRFSVNESLRSTDQGEFILPDDYKAGDIYPALELAGNIFVRESNCSYYTGETDNINYRFGDPVPLSNGGYRYPEIVGYFKEYGESYKETLLRVYRTIIDTSEQYERFLGNTEIIVISHGQIYHLFRGLSEIARMITSKQIEFEKGDSISLSWEIYRNCSDEQKVPGICMPLDFSYLGDESMMILLRKEIDYLEQIR